MDISQKVHAEAGKLPPQNSKLSGPWHHWTHNWWNRNWEDYFSASQQQWFQTTQNWWNRHGED
jgi:hypothetical protein